MRPRLLPLLLLLSLLSPSLSRLSPPRSSGKPSGKRPASLPSCLELRAGSSDYRYFIAGEKRRGQGSRASPPATAAATGRSR